jgi:hypothetical protein
MATSLIGMKLFFVIIKALRANAVFFHPGGVPFLDLIDDMFICMGYNI